MKILKGRVQDPGFSDVECTYLKTDDGAIYVFIADGQLSNGNIIATPILKEGINHAPYTSLGLITPTGQVLIPFENKNIKPLKNNLLLVERNVPQTPSVVEASSKQSDPLSASTFMETANTIKEQMKGVIGINGTYLFDNQFSEAALYTQDGANVGGSYFSFIFETSDNSYFMSTNVIGEAIMRYDANAQVESDSSTVETNQPIEDLPEESVSSSIGDTSEEVKLPTIANQPTADVVEDNQKLAGLEEPIAQPQVNEKIENDSSDVSLPFVQMSEGTVESDGNESQDGAYEYEKQEESDAESMDNQVENQSVNNMMEETTEEQTPSSIQLDIKNDVNEFETGEVDETSESAGMEEDYDENGGFSLEQESDEIVEDNDLEDTKNFDDSQDDYIGDETTNPIILDATHTIRKLLDENRKQRQLIEHQENEIEALNSSNEIYKEENASFSEEVSSLRASIKKYRKENMELSRENTRLQTTTERQGEIIDHLKNQNVTLKEQVAGINALGNAVAEANTLFTSSHDDSNYDDYDISSNSSEFSYLGEEQDGYQYTKKAA